MNKDKEKTKLIVRNVIIIFAFFLSFTAFFSAQWYINIFGVVGFRAIIFTLLLPMEGTASGIVYDWLLNGLLPSVICTAVLSLFYLLKIKIKKFEIKKIVREGICLVICVCLWLHAITIAEIPFYVGGSVSETEIYEKEYVNPNKTTVTFPENKQNLIYIFLESMEVTYLSEEQGGALKQNVIPELYSLAKKNTNFSHNDSVGGWSFVTNTSWTTAAMAAQTAGIPLTLPLSNTVPKEESNLLPKITTINDILHKNGYTQTVMFGSKSNYGGKANFFKQHGVDKILDYDTAQTDNIIPGGYFVWWGMEDTRLIEYAKKEITNLSAGDKPFCFTMLTADTHHIAGYKCPKCEDTFENQYENVLRCSSKQISELVKWIKAQPFFENTTVVLIGDHLSMDEQFFKNNIDSNYTRRVYNCFINPRVKAENSKNRTLTPMDIFPTTLAAIGCEIKGNRLGLGTNLFSNKKTLAEEMTLEKLNDELNKNSTYYNENFIG